MDDGLLDLGYSLALKHDALSRGSIGQGVAYLMSDGVQAELEGIFRRAKAHSLDIERKHQQDKASESQRVLSLAAVSRNSREPAMLLLSNGVQGLQNGMGLTPAMGWSSWNTFRCEINEKLIHQVARAVVHTGLRDAGSQCSQFVL